MPFRKFAVHEGIVSSNTAIQLTDDAAAWSIGQFAPGMSGQEATGASSFYVEIRSDAHPFTGKRFAVTTNSATELQVAGGAQAGLTNDALAGTVYAIVAEQRVRDIMGEPDAPLIEGGSDVLSADNVLFWSGSSWERIYCKTSGNPPYLVDHWLLGSTIVDDKIIERDGAFFVRRRATSNLVLHVAGEVPLTAQWIDLHTGYNLVGGGWNAPVTIADTSLTNVISGGTNQDNADTILEWGGSSWLAPVYYKTSGNPPFLVGHWVRGATSVDTTFTLQPRQGYIIRSSTNTVWRKKREWSD